jgi:L-threonylcarbamoyladenylate synthase
MNIKQDDVFIYPTDTVWGIGCSIYSKSGYDKIAEIKKSAKEKPLSIMFSSPKEVFQSFHFPDEITLEWLTTFFLLETTLGYPLSEAKIKIPRWATGESDFASIRCLTNTVIGQIHADIKAPFFTTSLNISGTPPIKTSHEAIAFHAKYAPDSHLLALDSKADLSGQASTIVFIRENLDFEIKREGHRIGEVKDHMMKLFC